VDRIITLPLEQLRNQINSPAGNLRARATLQELIEKLRDEEYDIVINRQFSNVEMYLSGIIEASYILGPYYAPAEDPEQQLQNLLVSLSDEVPPGDARLRMDYRTARHIWRIRNDRKRYLTNLVDVGFDLLELPHPGEVRLAIDPDHRRTAEKFLEGPEPEDVYPMLGIQVGASKNFRHLPVGLLAEALNRFQELHQGRLFFFGLAEETKMADAVIQGLHRPDLTAGIT
jgi:ADP-heptose:LPS heptosyltransferase